MLSWFRYEDRRVKQKRKVPLWVELKYQLEHAFWKPVFQQQVLHPVSECPLCFESIRHHGKHVTPHIPLHYQDEPLSSAFISRLAWVVSDTLSLDQLHQWQTLCQKTLDSQIVRVFSTQSDHLPVTETVSEMQHVLDQQKQNSHFLIYWSWDTVSPLTQLLTSARAKHWFVWLCLEGAWPDEWTSFPLVRYRFHDQTCQRSGTTPPRNDVPRLFILTGEDLGRAAVTHLKHTRGRTSLYEMLQTHPTWTLHTNQISDLRKVFWGFG